MNTKRMLLALVVLTLSIPAALAQVDDRNETYRLDVSQFSDGFKAALNRTPAEWEQSAQVAEYQHKMINLTIVPNASGEKRVRPLVDRIVKASHQPDLEVTVVIFRSAEVNAYANAAKYIYVSTGLLRVVKDDETLAFVLAHEVAHLMARSVERRMECMDGQSDELADLAASRQLEHEADVLGLYYAEKAGFRYEGLRVAMDILGEQEREAEKMLIRQIRSAKKAQTNNGSELEAYLRGLKEHAYRSHPTIEHRKETMDRVHAYMTEKNGSGTLPQGTQYVFTAMKSDVNEAGSLLKQIVKMTPKPERQNLIKRLTRNLVK